jgi:drug/metabolite transporter (DMT)-like permease
MAVETIPPFYVIGLRCLGGSILILGTAGLAGRLRSWPTLRQIGGSVLLGTLLMIGGTGLITIAEQKVDSYIAALIIAGTPMIVAFYDRVLLNKQISLVRLIGIGIGITGVAFLLYNGSSFAASLSPEIGMVLGGVASWGLGTTLGHRLKTYPDPLVNSGIQMLFVGIVCTIGSIIVYDPLPQIAPAVSLRSGLGLLYLAIVGSTAYGAYTYLIAHEPAIRVVSYSLVNPVIATLLGLLVGDETPVPFLAAGLPLVLVGVALMLYGETALQRWKEAAARTRPVTESDRGKVRDAGL